MKTSRLGRRGDKFEDALDHFLAQHVRPKNRIRTAAETERLFDKKVRPRWKGRRLNQIRRRDVIELLDDVAAAAPISANRVLAAIRRFFNWAVERDLLASSPCVGVKGPTAEVSRDRVLSAEEMREVWSACLMLGEPFGPMVQLLLLTCQRLSEVAGMRWSEIDEAESWWRLPRERTKNGIAHDVPLAPTAVALLASLKRFAGTPDFVLTTGYGRKTPAKGEEPSLVHVSGFSKAKRHLDTLILAKRREDAMKAGHDPEKVVAPPEWRFHDLRRTVSTGLAGLGVRLEVSEKVLNHTSGSFGGVAGVYQKHSYAAEKRDALDRWGACLGRRKARDAR